MADTRSLTLAASGALAMGYVLAALYFTKFWRRAGAGLFAWFAVAFAMLAVQRIALILSPDREGLHWSYALRLLAFLLILAGIAAQNRAPRRPRSAARR